MTPGNITVNSRVGLLFPDWSIGGLLQVSGRALVDWDPVITSPVDFCTRRTRIGVTISAVVTETAELDALRMSYRRAGSGNLLVVLVHGWPETSACWRNVIGNLGTEFTVIAPDLRGYGASGFSESGYDKRETAADLHQLIHKLGWESAHVAGHDRGARVAHRWALDYPADIRRLALLDILPTREVMRSIDLSSSKRLWHWFFHLQPGLAEVLLNGNTDAYLKYFLQKPLDIGAIDDITYREYLRAFSDPRRLAASLEDYRAGFGVDLEADERDFLDGVRITAPLKLLWGADGGLGKDDVVTIWRSYATEVSGAAVKNCRHYVPEEQPMVVARHLQKFFEMPT